MTRSPMVMLMEAYDHVTALVTACTNAGMEVQVLERSRKIKVSDPRGHPEMADEITLHPDTTGVLTWYWSWGAPIAPASDVDLVLHWVKHVVTSTPDM